MKKYKKPDRWNERASCFETEFKIFEHIINQNISKLEAEGIISMLCREWFGEDKGQIINSIIKLEG